MNRKKISVISASMLAIVMLVAAPANAAYDDYCMVTAGLPYKSGTEVRAQATASCLPGYRSANLVGAELQEQVGPLWAARGGEKIKTTSPQTTVSLIATYNCSGHGTDNWRLRAQGGNSLGEYSYYKWSAAKSITC